MDYIINKAKNEFMKALTKPEIDEAEEKRIKELEKKLTAEFVRIHRSTIVNLHKVRSVDAIPKGECLLHLDDDVSLKVSRNYRSAVQDLMG